MFKLESTDGMSFKSLKAFPFCEMASFLFLGKGGAQPVVWSTLVHCPTVALKTNWVKIHWCRVFQSVPTRGENKCDKWARLNLHSRLITLQKQLARRTVLMAMDGETETGNTVEMGWLANQLIFHFLFPAWTHLRVEQCQAYLAADSNRNLIMAESGKTQCKINFVSDLAKKNVRLLLETR